MSGSNLKRKAPSWANSANNPPPVSRQVSTPSLASGSGGGSSGSRPVLGAVKSEYGVGGGRGGGSGSGDWKRSKLDTVTTFTGMDPRTAAMDLEEELKSRGTMPLQDAHFWVQENVPECKPQEVVELLKKRERVNFNTANLVLSYVPSLVISTQAQLLAHIRVKSNMRQALNLRDPIFKDATKDQPVTEWLVDLEKQGEVLLSRGMGQFSQMELPKLGRKNGLGSAISDIEKGSNRIKGVFWDEVRGRDRAGKRVDEDFIHLWADVPLAETDDVAKLLAQQDLSSSSNIPEAPKVIPGAAGRKKKKSNRALKITNTHMKALGIDFSQDYVAGSS